MHVFIRLSLNERERLCNINVANMQRECLSVAEHLKVDAITGAQATKDRFLHELSSASIMHIGT